jgi:hypothetical protein
MNKARAPAFSDALISSIVSLPEHYRADINERLKDEWGSVAKLS